VVPQEIADRCNLVPRLLRELSLPVSGNVTGRLRNNFDATLDGPLQFEIATIDGQLDTGRHFGDRINILQNVAQADQMRPFDHLKDLNRLGFNISPQQRVKSFARREVGRTAQDMRQTLAHPDQLDEAKPIRIIVDEQIDIARLRRLPSRGRAEQVKRGSAERPDIGGLVAKQGQNIGASHSPPYSRNVRRKLASARHHGRTYTAGERPPSTLIAVPVT
jgi:hypothetical protein